jgi:hypothetical protein
VTTTFKVIGTDHFGWPPEEYPAGEFATRAQGGSKKAEIQKTSMNRP